MYQQRKTPVALVSVAIVMFCACTRSPTPAIQIPTAAVLPTVTPTVTATPRCDLKSWWEESSSEVVRFMDVVDVALATPRGSLSPVLLEMREVFRGFERESYPNCASDVRDAIVEGMQGTVDGFNDFLSEDEYSSNLALQVASLRFWSAALMLSREGVRGDERLLQMAYDWVGFPNEATAAWIAEVGEQGLRDKIRTATWTAMGTLGVELNMTMTAVFSR